MKQVLDYAIIYVSSIKSEETFRIAKSKVELVGLTKSEIYQCSDEV